MTPSTFTFNHPDLGRMIGHVTPDNVVEFRAVPYAALPARFKHSIPLDNLNGTDRDFTKPGFACPHRFGEDIFSGGPYPGESPTPTDEYKSLILQINVPLACLHESPSKLSNLPVLVYIHGGGFVLGKIDAKHNIAPIATHSLALATPTITASLQYRLGALGFLSTPDGGKNFGLHDQRNALLWIQKFVRGFGGDAKRITAFGESAGSISICCHLISAPPPSGPLFHRAILMSGIIGPQTSPPPEAESAELYSRLLSKLDITEHSEEAALEKLREVDVQKIVDASAALTDEAGILLPVQDEEWFQGPVSWESIPELIGKCDWVEEIITGTTGFEATTMLSLAKLLTPKNFAEALKEKFINEQSIAKILDLYGIAPDMDQNLFLTAAMQYFGDVLFDGPTHALCQHLSTQTSKRIYRYIFDVRNPFPNHNLYQQPHHWVDKYFIFRTLQFRYPTQKLKDISDKHAQLWIDFANGKKPWNEYKYSGDGKEVLMIADNRDGWIVRSEAEDEKIEERSWRRVEGLWKVFEEQGGKRFLPLQLSPLKTSLV